MLWQVARVVHRACDRVECCHGSLARPGVRNVFTDNGRVSPAGQDPGLRRGVEPAAYGGSALIDNGAPVPFDRGSRIVGTGDWGDRTVNTPSRTALSEMISVLPLGLGSKTTRGKQPSLTRPCPRILETPLRGHTLVTLLAPATPVNNSHGYAHTFVSIKLIESAVQV